jgi:hypothetical protein
MYFEAVVVWYRMFGYRQDRDSNKLLCIAQVRFELGYGNIFKRERSHGHEAQYLLPYDPKPKPSLS